MVGSYVGVSKHEHETPRLLPERRAYKEPKRVQSGQNSKVGAGGEPSLEAEDAASHLGPGEPLGALPGTSLGALVAAADAPEGELAFLFGEKLGIGDTVR